MTREGYDIHFPRTVHDVSQSDEGITLYAPCKDINHRGDTLDGPLLTVKLSSPMANVVRVQTWHYKGRQNKGPHFDIAQTDDQPQIAAKDRKSTRLNSSHVAISYAVFCLKKKTKIIKE